MKKIIFLIAASILAVSTFAQEVRTLKCLFGFGYSPSWPIYGHPSGNGFILNFEPSYFVKNHLSIGARFEMGLPGQTISSIGLNSQYYVAKFASNNFRPFVGLGVGLYHPSLDSRSNTPPFASLDSESKIGFYPRIGFDYRHMTVVLDYNIVPTSQATVSYGYPNLENGNLKSSYLALKVGMFFGGKKVTYKIEETKFAQTYSKFRVGIGFGFSPNWSFGEPYSSNLPIISLEPSYRIKNNIALGVRLETTIFRTSSYGINGQYYFSNNQFRPFAGIGLGYYYRSFDGTFPYDIVTPKSETDFGFYPRFGFDYGHFSFTLDYNILAPTTIATTYFIDLNQTGPTTTITTSTQNNYLGIKFGVFFGGGRKRATESDQ